MKRILLLFFWVFSSVVSAKTYYVSTTGKDTNVGTIENPWATWEKAISMAYPGDIVYFRGGVYFRTNCIHINATTARSGTAGNPICYFNYPGESPIFDYSTVKRASYYNAGMGIEDIYFLNFKGLTFRNIWQKYNGVTSSGVAAQGIQVTYGANMTFENMTFYNIGGRAFAWFGGFTTEPGGNRIPSMTYDTLRIINCDAYNLCDSLCISTDPAQCSSSSIGGWADGFKVDAWVGAYTYIYGCRAWHYSDNGIDVSSSGYTVIDNCWTWRGGDFNFTGPDGAFHGEGSGIKYGGLWDAVTTVTRTITHNISAYNKFLGFDENNTGSWFYPMNIEAYNNTSYKNQIGFGNFSTTGGRYILAKYRNNISYVDAVYARGCEQSSGVPCDILERYNSWDSASCDRPTRERIPLTNADFVSLDSSQLRRPRKADNSLPDITFLHLASTSDAIDAGTNVGLPYSGTAPDLGAFEYSATSNNKPVTSITITGAGGVSTIKTDNGTLQLSAAVLPSDATNKTVTWSIYSGKDKASINSAGLVTALDNGSVVARATANDGSGVYGALTITITNQVIPVSAITLTGAGGSTTITTDNGTLQLSVNVLPSNATNKTVTWSISNGTDKASINSSGLVTAIDNGTVTARATANDGTGIYGILTITVSNQVITVSSITVTGAGGATTIASDNGILQITANVLPANATNKTITWSLTSGTDKASISSTGLVTALDNGTAVAKASANDGSGVYGILTITISNQVIPVTSITIAGESGRSLITVIGGTLQLSASVLPSNATNKTVTWSISSGTDKASISSTGLITALDNGTSIAKAVANDGSGVYNVITITISNQVIPVSSVTVTGAGGVSAISSDNGTLQLSANVLPVNATNKTVIWSISSGTEKASISSSGLITALDNGTVTARATTNDGSGVYGILVITISNQVIPVSSVTVTGAGGISTITTENGSLQLSAAILPANATNKTVTWSISNGTDKATISSAGLVTAIGNGSVTARATTIDGSGIYGVYVITISYIINSPPVIMVNYRSSIYSGFVNEINASGSYDANHDNLTFTWIVPINVSVSSTTGSSIKYLGPIVNSSQLVEFTLRINDGKTTQSKVIPVEILPYKPELEVAEISNIEASGYQSPYYPYNLIDGDIGTMWSVEGVNQWLVVELKHPFTVQHVKIAFQPGQRKESYFDILGSVDKVNWEPILTKSASCDFSGDLQVFDFPSSKTGKEINYIKLVGQGNSTDLWNYISELRIFGYRYRKSPAYENLPVKVYPNPVREFVTIRIDESSLVPDYVQITGISGTVLMRNKMDPDVREFTIPVNLKKGLYIIQLISGNITLFAQKLIVSN
jgi:uncharacterized protein YjdB